MKFLGNQKFRKGITLLALIIILHILRTPAWATEHTEKNVLILNSYHKGYQWSDDIVKGMEDVLKAGLKNVNLSVDYMDTKRVSEEAYFEKLYDVYTHKYQGEKFDIIFCSDNDAFHFLKSYGNRLFPEVPIVFCGVNHFRDEMRTDSSHMTGIAENPDIKGTLDMALTLQPDTNQIYFVFDNTTTGKIFKEEVTNLSHQYRKKVEFIINDKTDITDVSKEIRNLQKNSIIFFLGQLKDREGEYISYEMGTQMIKANSTVPVYSAWEFMMKYGILGGQMINGYDHGVQAGQLGLRILGGEAPKDISVIHYTPSRYIFDYQELKRFNIPTKELPLGSVILRLPSSLYTISKNITYAFVGGIIVILSIIISILLRNIRKLRETKKALRESEEQLRNLINAMPDFVCFKDGDGHWIEVNHACQEVFGLEGIEYKGKRDEDLSEIAEFTRGGLLTCKKTDELAWKNGSISWAEEMIPGKDKTEKIFDVCKVPLFKEDGSRKGIVILGRDITKRKKDSERIQQLKEEVEHDKLRTEFFANLSHELRTPLNLILGTVQLLEMNIRNSEMSDKDLYTIRRMKIVKQNCFRLLRLVNNLIDITKVDAGFLELEEEHHNIVSIIEEITLSVAEYTEQQNIHLQFDTEIEERIMLCDPDKIERIMLNLLSNAIKFSKPGGDIMVNVYDREDRILISVKDTGIGIHADKLELVFERFRQVDKSFTRNHEGSGIGLSLVKSLVELHGGRITLKSQYGQGSEFLIDLPVRSKGGMASEHQKPMALQSRVESIHIEFSDIYG